MQSAHSKKQRENSCILNCLLNLRKKSGIGFHKTQDCKSHLSNLISTALRTCMFYVQFCFVVFFVLFCFLHHSIIEPCINKPPPSWYCSLYTWKGLFCITTPAKSPREKMMIIRLILPWLQYMVVYFFRCCSLIIFLYIM